MQTTKQKKKLIKNFFAEVEKFFCTYHAALMLLEECLSLAQLLWWHDLLHR